MSHEPVIALAGNPNSGKTSIFNALTGARQHVANYPGITVEIKEGGSRAGGVGVKVVDLPGAYSLTPYSPDEVAARDYLLEQRPDVVIHVVDASSLERNLYLTTQLMELGVPVIIALNMIDIAEMRGIRIDSAELSSILGVPVIRTVGNRGTGTDALLEKAVAVAGSETSWVPIDLSYGTSSDRALAILERMIVNCGLLADVAPPRWLALRLLEQDSHTIDRVERLDTDGSREILDTAGKLAEQVFREMNDETEGVIADHRYGFVAGVVKRVRTCPVENRLYFSDRIDRFLTNPVLGPVVMAAVLFGLFQFTFMISRAPISWVESLFGWLHVVAWDLLPRGFIRSMVVSGAIDGVGGVVGFVPLIMFMFFFISILEDTGYMARIAFLMDRIFRKFGLHGSSIVPFIVSGGITGGCAVPGIMAARTLRDTRERFATILSVPFMNCGAKLPVYALLIGAFFSSNEGTVLFGLTILSWTFAMLSAKLLRSTVLRGESTSFVLELPPYRLPSIRSLLIHMWERTWLYLRKAGTVILLASVIMWGLMTFPALPEELAEGLSGNQLAQASLSHSIAGRAGRIMENATRPLMGFDWKVDVALIGGFAAKEIVVSTLGTAYSMSEVEGGGSVSLSEKLATEEGWNPVMALALIVFTMLYIPCIATIAVIKRETGSWGWAGFAILYTTGVAAVMATLVYQAGTLIT
ncbi:MAG: ferrous iron transport protein B [Candidatus Fermentibacteraceae bacterium]|nr:ferrous iron transport protein B [Candidatus Fermentibacteraceae bacterium]MBN2609254.1 ferrous iron transport protein B [Candidatus Fermentibacteraceae bacterium]